MEKNYENWFHETSKDSIDHDIKLAGYLWNEYQYRHEHCWNLTFKFTLTVVALGVIPYVKKEIVEKIGYWTIIPPVLGFIFAWIGFIQLKKELNLLDHVRSLYRPLQDSITVPYYKNKKSTFTSHVKLYFRALIAASICNLYAIIFVWIPTVPEEVTKVLTESNLPN